MLLQLAEGKFSHKDGPDGRFHTVVCRGCSKSGHLKKAGQVDMGDGKTSHAFQCTNCGETTRVVNQTDEQIKAGGSEVNNAASRRLEEGLLGRGGNVLKTFDPGKHKRDADGRFAKIIAGLPGQHPDPRRSRAVAAKIKGTAIAVIPTRDGYEVRTTNDATGTHNESSMHATPAEAAAEALKRHRRLSEAKDSLAKASTPKPFSKSKTSNWVARGGGLPPYIQHVAHALVEKRGKTESEAIRMAIGIVKNWAAGKGNVDANTKAAAAKAVAQWMKLRAKAAGKRAAKTAKSIAEAELIESLLALEEGEVEELEESFLLELAEDAPMGFEVGDPVRRHEPDANGNYHFGEQGRVVAENVDPDTGAYIYDVRWRSGIQRDVRQFDLRNVRDMSLAEARGTKAKTPLPKPPKEESPAKAEDRSSSMEAAGDRVGHLQRRLTSLGFELTDDGQFGPVTQAAVKDFQRNAILVPDGIVGPKTTEALAGAPTPEDMASDDTDGDGVPDAAETTTDATGHEGTAVNRSSGATAETLYKGLGVGVDEPHVGVAAMQQRLQKSGYADLEADGRFGPETEKIVKRFQRKWGLRADGMYGRKTGKALDGVVAKTEQLAEAIDVRSSTSGIEFVRAYGRELALRRQLEEGNSGLEAMIAKLVAAGIPADQAKAIAAKNIGGGKDTPSAGGGKAVEMRRMPNGMFAPKGQGEILKLGDTVKVPHAHDKENVKGKLIGGKVTNVDKIGTAQVELDDGPDKGQPFQVAAAHNPAWASSGSETPDVEGAADSVKAKVAAAAAKHGSPSVQTDHIAPSADATPGTDDDADLSGSPGRGPSGKLRNFKAMSGTKLKKTIADLTAFGKDAEALEAVKAIAKEKGVAWAEPDAPAPAPKAKAKPTASAPEAEPAKEPDAKPTVKSYDPKTGPSAEEKAANAAKMHGAPAPAAAPAKPKSEPSAMLKGGPKAGGGKGPSGVAKLPETLSPNVGGYSLHELPLGATFSLADGVEYHTHKQVGNEGQWMIAKPVGGGKAKPFHKMLAPANVGPQVEGYAGAEGSAGAPEVDAAAEDDLAAKLESSVAIAKKAKMSGGKPDFKQPEAASAAPVANAAALAAYEAAGGTDPAIIAALKAAVSAAPAKMAA
ncbi:MAG: peptidoglycan-binding protein [Baekduia sp.]